MNLELRQFIMTVGGSTLEKENPTFFHLIIVLPFKKYREDLSLPSLLLQVCGHLLNWNDLFIIIPGVNMAWYHIKCVGHNLSYHFTPKPLLGWISHLLWLSYGCHVCVLDLSKLSGLYIQFHLNITSRKYNTMKNCEMRDCSFFLFWNKQLLKISPLPLYGLKYASCFKSFWAPPP